MPKTDGQRSRTVLLLASVIAVATLVLYLPALQNGFLIWDDSEYVYSNLNIQSFDLEFLRWSLTAVVIGSWHPLTLVSHALDYKLFGLNPAGHHFTAILLHSINTFLVALVAFRLCVVGSHEAASGSHGSDSRGETRALVVAAFTAVLFGFHPLHVESVAWVAERKDVLCALFFLLSILAYLKYTVGHRYRFYILSLAALILSLLSKPMAVSLPLVLFIMDFYPLKRIKNVGALKRVLLEKAILFVPCLFAMVMAIWSEGVVDPESAGAQHGTPLITRLVVSVRAFAFYIYKMVWPLDISPFYPYPVQADLFSVLTGLAMLLFFVSAFFAIYFYRKRSYFGAAWLYYLITLLPVIGIVRIGIQGAADRYTYLPSISLFMLVGLLAYHLADRYSKRVLTTALVAVVIMAALLAFKTSYQIKVWKDSVSLWDAVIEYTSESAAVPYLYRGIAYKMQGDYDMAIVDLTRAIELKPDSVKSYVNRAALYRKTGDFYKAIEDNLKVIEFYPGKATAYNNLGAAYASLGNFVEAQKNFRIATELDPGLKDAQNNLKRVLMLVPSPEPSPETERQ